MAVLSKLKGLSLPYNCYEVVHPWEPDCNCVALIAGGRAFYEALKLYAPLYLATYLLKRKFNLETTIHTIHNLLISSSFLGYYGFFLYLLYCLTRKLVGSFNNIISSYFPAFIASLLCYFVERESRRRTLAVYLANAATETALRMAVSRGIVKPYPNAGVYLFSATIAAFLFFIKKWGFSEDAVSGVIKFLFGTGEAKRKTQNGSGKTTSHAKKQFESKEIAISNRVAGIQDIMRGTFLHRICTSRHISCGHTSGCIVYSLQGFLRPFFIGYLASSAMRCLSMRKKLQMSPSYMLPLLTEKRNFNLGLFLGGLGGTFKVVNCLLRWCFGKDQPVYAIPAGLLGGMSMQFFPSSTLSLYLLWKLIEFGYLSGIEAGTLPNVIGFKPILLSASTALLFHTSALEPHNLKPSYWRFLQQITNNRMSLINRRLLDVFGTHAVKMNPDFWPELDHRYTSESLTELALLWLSP